jgi:uncharacterized protein
VARVDARRNDASDADAKVAIAQEKYEVGTVAWRRLDAAAALPALVARARDLVK